jgi:tRNA/rRNA methyltransferase
MRNFGVKDLILVAPKASLEEARPFAAQGVEVLERARLARLEEVREDYDLMVATSAIATASGKLRRQAVTPRRLLEMLEGRKLALCLVFGRDTTGLTRQELELCDLLLHIPTGTDYPTLNLSHAVAIVLYELSGASRRRARGLGLAPRAHRERILAGFMELAEAVGFPAQKREVLRRAIKGVLARSLPTRREATLILGLTRKIRLALERAQARSSR